MRSGAVRPMMLPMACGQEVARLHHEALLRLDSSALVEPCSVRVL